MVPPPPTVRALSWSPSLIVLELAVTLFLRRLSAVALSGVLVATAAQQVGPGGSAAAVGSSQLSRFAEAVAESAAGIGDAYFPLDGNGGYDVRHYGVAVRYRPATRLLTGTTTVRLTAERRLERFNLDLLLRASKVTVRGVRVTFDQKRHELTIRPGTAIAKGRTVAVTVAYRGKPAGLRYRGEQPF